MPGPSASGELLLRVPAFLRRLSELETVTGSGLTDALAASEYAGRTRDDG